MAAAETATAGGTRRAVIRSERFVQWQRALSSARRAPYGSRKRNDDGKINNIQIHQKESKDVNETQELRGMEEEAGEDDDCHKDISNVRLKKQQRQASPDCKMIEREIILEHTKDSSEAGLCNGQQNQLTPQVHPQQRQEHKLQQQQEPPSALPIKRRRRRASNKAQELQRSRRSADGDAIAKMDLSSKASKRSTRLLARTLQIEEPLPPPLKLPKLHVVLSRKEVQEDWLKMTGRRYTGKPRKSALIHLGLALCTSLTCPSSIRYLTNP